MQRWVTILLGIAGVVWSMGSWALTADEVAKLAVGENEARIAMLNQVASRGDQAALPYLQSLLDDSVKIAQGHAYLFDGEAASDPLTHRPVALPPDAEDVVNNNQMRGELEAAIAVLKLVSPDAAVRLEAAKTLQDADPQESRLPLVTKAVQAEMDAKVRTILAHVRDSMRLVSHDKQVRLTAAEALGDSQDAQSLLLSRLAADGEADPEVRTAINTSLKKIERRLAIYEHAGHVFTGISLGSILLLAALGLAITYGLLGVINMAHGELMMIGAYATYVVQNLFHTYLPEHFQWYLLPAVPVAFLVTALVGILMERSVLRFLYGRPLETLLATWGISLILMQLVRTFFGAQNVGVENPAWMSGGIEIAANLVLPFNRIYIIAFAVLVLLMMWLLISKTRLGLFIRAVTQNRTMAGCVGVNTARVDSLAFGLGAGVAGLAGVALSQIGNVGPGLGQGYIVDSFMVVVLGGVGQLSGAVVAAMGLGVLSKFFEGMMGAVLAKILVLVFIIVFIQKRPQGLFALKGRFVEN